jgi:hypothetical protein
MNVCCSGVKIILIDNILRTKLLRQLMTFLTDLLDQKFFETYGRSVTLAMLIRVRGSFRNSNDACKRSGGQHFEHLNRFT